MRTFFKSCGILLFASSLLSGCATLPKATHLTIEELEQKVRGMSQEQLLACMGPPGESAKDGNMQFLIFSYGNFWAERCDANFVLTDGRVSKFSVTPYTFGLAHATSGLCRAVVAKCLP